MTCGSQADTWHSAVSISASTQETCEYKCRQKASSHSDRGVATKASCKLDIKRGWGKAAAKTWCHTRTSRESDWREQVMIWLRGRAGWELQSKGERRWCTLLPDKGLPKILKVKKTISWKFSFVIVQWHVNYCSSSHRNARRMQQRLVCTEREGGRCTWWHPRKRTQGLTKYCSPLLPPGGSKGRAGRTIFDDSKTPFPVLTALKITVYLKCETN